MRVPNSGQHPYDCEHDWHSQPTAPAATSAAGVFTVVMASRISQRLGTQSHERVLSRERVRVFGYPGHAGQAHAVV
eukprot:scaffold56526_cov69-Phaeocystis_antarctica.AAC.2